MLTCQFTMWVWQNIWILTWSFVKEPWQKFRHNWTISIYQKASLMGNKPVQQLSERAILLGGVHHNILVAENSNIKTLKFILETLSHLLVRGWCFSGLGWVNLRVLWLFADMSYLLGREWFYSMLGGVPLPILRHFEAMSHILGPRW